MWFRSWGSGVYRQFKSDAKNTKASGWDTGPCPSVGGQAISQDSSQGSPGLQGQPVWTADGEEMPSQIRLGFRAPGMALTHSQSPQLPGARAQEVSLSPGNPPHPASLCLGPFPVLRPLIHKGCTVWSFK